jgi:hypothetical protein
MAKVLLNTHLSYDWFHGVNVCGLILPKFLVHLV